MGGSSKKGGGSKAEIPKYYLSQHQGVCQGPVDAVKAIWVGEKRAWNGNVTGNQTVSISREGLFGGIKKEGGVSGQVEIMMGHEDQTAPGSLVSRLKTGSVANTPGFRGILSLFFRGGSKGFYWGTQAYLKPIWVTLQRIPARALNPATAPIPRTPGNSGSIYFCLDDSGSMAGTRMDTLKSAMGSALDLIQGAVDSGLRMDVGISAMISGFIHRPNATAQDISDIRDWVNARPASGHTPFDIPVQRAVNWFEATQNDSAIFQRVMVFITDGEPTGHSHITAANTAAHLLDRTIPVDMYGINIELQDTQYTAFLDNTPEDGVPVVTGSDPGPLVSVITNALTGLTADVVDANPAHVIYECLTDTDWGLGVDPSTIDTDSFVSASARLWGEQFGLFLQWQAPSTIEDFINMVLDHINGAIFPHPRTGKTSLRLLRDDLDTENLKVIDPDNAVLTNFGRKGWGETTNEIVVTWTNPETEREETIRAQDLANIAQQGAVISDSRNYHGVRTAALAQRLADRELRSASAPLCSCEAEVDREFWDTVPFDGVKVTWPEHGLNELVMRVMKVNYGTSDSSVIRLSLVEDIFALPLASYVKPETGEWESEEVPPVPVTTARLMPTPAYMVSNAGVNLELVEYPSTAVTPLAVNPTTSDDAHYDVMGEGSTPSGGSTWVEIGGTRRFVGRARLADSLLPGAESTEVALVNATGAAAEPDGLLLIGGDELADDELELALITAVDEATGQLTLLRGALDTVPRLWPASTRVSIALLQEWVPLPAEAADQQSVKLKFLTSTAAGRLEESEAPEFEGTALSRPSRPTRAAHVQINGEGVEAWDGILASDVLTVTWKHRNRLLEDSVMYRWDADSLPLEDGVTYRVESDAYDSSDSLLQANWFSENVGTVDNFELDLTANPPPQDWRSLRVRVVAERNDEDAWQSAELLVLPLLPPTDLSAGYLEVLAPTDLQAEYISEDELDPTEGLSSQDELLDNQDQVLLSGDAQETDSDGIEYG